MHFMASATIHVRLYVVGGGYSVCIPQQFIRGIVYLICVQLHYIVPQRKAIGTYENSTCTGFFTKQRNPIGINWTNWCVMGIAFCFICNAPDLDAMRG